MMNLLRRSTAIFLSILLALMPLLPAQAAMIGNEQIVHQGLSHQTRDGLQQLFEQETAQQQLQAWGVSPDQIKSRIDSLTDAELARINQQVNDLNAGSATFLVFCWLSLSSSLSPISSVPQMSSRLLIRPDNSRQDTAVL